MRTVSEIDKSFSTEQLLIRGQLRVRGVYGFAEAVTLSKIYKFESDGKVSDISGTRFLFSHEYSNYRYDKLLGNKKFVEETMMTLVDDFTTGPKKYGYKLTPEKKSIDTDDMEEFDNFFKTVAAQIDGKGKITGAYKKVLKKLKKDTKYSLYEEYLGSTEIDNETFYILKTVREFKYSGKNEGIKAWLELASGGYIYFIHADSGYVAVGYNLKSDTDNIMEEFLNRVCTIYKNNKPLIEISLKKLLN